MLKIVTKRSYMVLVHALVLALGMCVLVAAAPLTDTEEEPAAWTMVSEVSADAFVMKDWWEIAVPDVTSLKIHVVSAVTEKTEADLAEILVADIAEEDLLVEAMGLESEMEILDAADAKSKADGAESSKADGADENTGSADESEAAEETLAASQTGGRVLTMEKAVTLSSAEYDALLRIVEAESGCEDIMGRILVANVILNRVASDKFPNTVQEVVTQTHYGSLGLTYQFTPAKPGGKYWSVTPTETTIEAVERALAGEDYSEGALYFAARKAANSSHMSWFDQKLTWLFQHGNHEFYID